MSIPIALTIAGSDSGGGAGIQADLKAFSALGVYGASVITALTAQNTREVRGIQAVPADFIALQLDAVFDDLNIDAVKTGMLGRADAAAVVADGLRSRAVRHLVVDPVMVSKSGVRLLEEDGVAVLRDRLLPLATVVTPNVAEAAALLGESPEAVLKDREDVCHRLLAFGSKTVVLKGGHAGGAESEDLFFDGRHLEALTARRIASRNTHGTGCTFASAIAAFLAHGRSPSEAVRAAKRYVTAAIEAADALRVGSGQGPVHHFHRLWGPGGGVSNPGDAAPPRWG